MGIQSLLPQLKSIADQVNVREYSGKTVGIDGYTWIHKGTYSCAQQLARGQHSEAWIKFCEKRLALLVESNVKPYFVFDGNNLPAKAGTEAERAESRKNALQAAEDAVARNDNQEAQRCFARAVDVAPAMVAKWLVRLRARDIPFIVAPYEADAQLAFLYKEKHIHAVLTEDSDLIPYGVGRVLFKMDNAGNGEEICLANLPRCEELRFEGWNEDMILNWCIMSGCDYLPSPPGIGCKKAHDFVSKHGRGDLKKLLTMLRLEKGTALPAGYEDGFKQARLTFLHQRVFDPRTNSLVHLRPFSAALAPVMTPAMTEFLGPLIPDELAAGIAYGEIDPTTQLPYPQESTPANTAVPGHGARAQGHGHAAHHTGKAIHPVFSAVTVRTGGAGAGASGHVPYSHGSSWTNSGRGAQAAAGAFSATGASVAAASTGTAMSILSSSVGTSVSFKMTSKAGASASASAASAGSGGGRPGSGRLPGGQLQLGKFLKPAAKQMGGISTGGAAAASASSATASGRGLPHPGVPSSTWAGQAHASAEAEDKENVPQPQHVVQAAEEEAKASVRPGRSPARAMGAATANNSSFNTRTTGTGHGPGQAKAPQPLEGGASKSKFFATTQAAGVGARPRVSPPSVSALPWAKKGGGAGAGGYVSNSAQSPVLEDSNDVHIVDDSEAASDPFAEFPSPRDAAASSAAAASPAARPVPSRGSGGRGLASSGSHGRPVDLLVDRGPAGQVLVLGDRPEGESAIEPDIQQADEGLLGLPALGQSHGQASGGGRAGGKGHGHRGTGHTDLPYSHIDSFAAGNSSGASYHGSSSTGLGRVGQLQVQRLGGAGAGAAANGHDDTARSSAVIGHESGSRMPLASLSAAISKNRSKVGGPKSKLPASTGAGAVAEAHEADGHDRTGATALIKGRMERHASALVGPGLAALACARKSPAVLPPFSSPEASHPLYGGEGDDDGHNGAGDHMDDEQQHGGHRDLNPAASPVDALGGYAYGASASAAGGGMVPSGRVHAPIIKASPLDLSAIQQRAMESASMGGGLSGASAALRKIEVNVAQADATGAASAGRSRSGRLGPGAGKASQFGTAAKPRGAGGIPGTITAAKAGKVGLGTSGGVALLSGARDRGAGHAGLVLDDTVMVGSGQATGRKRAGASPADVSYGMTSGSANDSPAANTRSAKKAKLGRRGSSGAGAGVANAVGVYEDGPEASPELYGRPSAAGLPWSKASGIGMSGSAMATGTDASAVGGGDDVMGQFDSYRYGAAAGAAGGGVGGLSGFFDGVRASLNGQSHSGAGGQGGATGAGGRTATADEIIAERMAMRAGATGASAMSSGLSGGHGSGWGGRLLDNQEPEDGQYYGQDQGRGPAFATHASAAVQGSGVAGSGGFSIFNKPPQDPLAALLGSHGLSHGMGMSMSMGVGQGRVVTSDGILNLG